MESRSLAFVRRPSLFSLSLGFRESSWSRRRRRRRRCRWCCCRHRRTQMVRTGTTAPTLAAITQDFDVLKETGMNFCWQRFAFDQFRAKLGWRKLFFLKINLQSKIFDLVRVKKFERFKCDATMSSATSSSGTSSTSSSSTSATDSSSDSGSTSSQAWQLLSYVLEIEMEKWKNEWWSVTRWVWCNGVWRSPKWSISPHRVFNSKLM